MSDTQPTPDPRQPEPGVEPDDLNAGSIVTIALISTALLVASVLGVTTLVDRFDVSQEQIKVADRTPKGMYFNGEQVFRTPDDALSDQENELYGYIARDDGTFVIEIERAKELVVAELINGRPGADAPSAESEPGDSEQGYGEPGYGEPGDAGAESEPSGNAPAQESVKG